jgi:Leucine-rich repeat (LRR) protein
LKELYCSNNQIESFEGLSSANLPNLKVLICCWNQIESFEGLSSLPNLEILDCSNNQIESLEDLSSENLPKLKDFLLNFNPLNFVYQNKELKEIYYINKLLKKCQDNTKIWIVKNFLKEKIKERLIRKD